jgi:glutathione S-transferase
MWTSTCSKKVRICLAEKNLDWDSRVIKTQPSPETLEPWYIKLNPNAVVPTLIHDERIVIESCVILEYLDDVFPEISLRPADFGDRATMRVWLDKSESVLHRYINVMSHNRFMAQYLDKLSVEEKTAQVERYPRQALYQVKKQRYLHGVSAEEEANAMAQLEEFMDDMEITLSRTPWLAGEEYSLADISITPFLERFAVNKLDTLIDWKKRPATGDWWQRIQDRPAFEKGMALHMKNE